MAVASPKYSFVQFDPVDPGSCCNGINSVGLPVVNNDDLFFQIISDSAPGNLEVIDTDGNVISTQSGFVAAPGTGYYSWQNAIDISGLACDQCFFLRVGSAVSNLFVKKCDDCFTTLLEYYNETDYAEFVYCLADFVSRVRVQMIISKPKWPGGSGNLPESRWHITDNKVTHNKRV